MFKISRFVYGFLEFGFEIYGFVSGFDVCMEGLIFRDVLGLLKIDGWVWVCVLCVLNL